MKTFYELYVKKAQKTYLAKNIRTGLYKIGRSFDPLKRVDNINREHPLTILLLIINEDVELLLHKKFKNKKVLIKKEREWFNLNSTDLLIIERVKERINN